jgi:hypothetical protein
VHARDVGDRTSYDPVEAACEFLAEDLSPVGATNGSSVEREHRQRPHALKAMPAARGGGALCTSNYRRTCMRIRAASSNACSSA